MALRETSEIAETPSTYFASTSNDEHLTIGKESKPNNDELETSTVEFGK
jgi:hypothetical protein